MQRYSVLGGEYERRILPVFGGEYLCVAGVFRGTCKYSRDYLQMSSI